MGDDEKGDQTEEKVSESLEFGDAEEEETDGNFGQGEGDEDLDPVKVIVFEETLVVFWGEVVKVSSEAKGYFEHHKAHAHRIDHLSQLALP